MASYDDCDYDNTSEDNNKNNHQSEDEEDDDNNLDEPEDDDQDTNAINQPEELTGPKRRRSRLSEHHFLPGENGGLEPWWTVNAHICPILMICSVYSRVLKSDMLQNDFYSLGEMKMKHQCSRSVCYYHPHLQPMVSVPFLSKN